MKTCPPDRENYLRRIALAQSMRDFENRIRTHWHSLQSQLTDARGEDSLLSNDEGCAICRTTKAIDGALSDMTLHLDVLADLIEPEPEGATQ